MGVNGGCTIQTWFIEFQQFLLIHGLDGKPERIWNADESGFPLSPNSGKVISLHSSKSVHNITGDSKDQITCLCAVSAAEETIPPMHIFAGEWFRYNPMKNCVPGAFFDRSPNGWIATELFFGWFAKKVTVRPEVLLVDGHSSHNDLEVSKFCFLPMPPHASHILQPLDVSFLKPLKGTWRKSCEISSWINCY